ncbi:hypothetical protein RJJ65_38340, partial [Rhizobium hidalgonense]
MSSCIGKNSFASLAELQVGDKKYHYYQLEKTASQLGHVDRLPKTLKILLENLLRFEDDISVKRADIYAIANW